MTKPVKCQNIGDHIFMRWVDLPPEGMWVFCHKSHPKACKFEMVEKPNVAPAVDEHRQARHYVQQGI